MGRMSLSPRIRCASLCLLVCRAGFWNPCDPDRGGRRDDDEHQAPDDGALLMRVSERHTGERGGCSYHPARRDDARSIGVFCAIDQIEREAHDQQNGDRDQGQRRVLPRVEHEARRGKAAHARGEDGEQKLAALRHAFPPKALRQFSPAGTYCPSVCVTKPTRRDLLDRNAS